MKSKIRVHGKSQSRTALGIINAYMELYPDTTPYELQLAFPKSLNSRCGADSIIIPVEETFGYEKMFFEQEDETIVFKNGEKYALIEIWIKEDFDAICKHAKQYGIAVAKKGTKPFEKGSFELEYLERDWRKCWSKCCCWLLSLLLLLLLIFCCCKKCSRSDKYTEPVESIPNERTVCDETGISGNAFSTSFTLPDGTKVNIATNTQEHKLLTTLISKAPVDPDKTKGWIPLDNVHFETGNAVLTTGSERQLKNIAMIMQFFRNSHIKVGGYTDDTGTDEINMRLSYERAKVAAEKLISFGIDENRITYGGYGSKHPISPLNDSVDGRTLNRRVDIRVTQK